MKKILSIGLLAFALTLSISSCQRHKAAALAPDSPSNPVAQNDTINVKVFFTDTVNNFASTDYTLTVVDVTNNVVVDSTVVSGIPYLTTFPGYAGNTIKMVKRSSDATYKVYLGGRKLQGFVSPPSTQTITVVSGNVKNVDDPTNNTAPNYQGQRYTWGYGEVIVSPTGTFTSQPHPNAAFSVIDPNGTYLVF